MARGSYDPWKKKSKAGSKILMSMLTTTYKVGKAVAKSAPKAKQRPVKNQGCMVTLLFFGLVIGVVVFGVFRLI
ncbi:hypothetical protein [Mucilaginibacter sp. 22184]|uniref:hypothetical protein n=1 Tax=Mucilaginibacter sp. 22184 TaxID=3453887 RepID=UPI003F825A83